MLRDPPGPAPSITLMSLWVYSHSFSKCLEIQLIPIRMLVDPRVGDFRMQAPFSTGGPHYRALDLGKNQTFYTWGPNFFSGTIYFYSYFVFSFEYASMQR